MPKMKTVDMSASIDDTPDKKTTKDNNNTDTDTKTTSITVQKKARSKRYVYARSQVDRTKTYEPTKAIELLYKITPKRHTTVIADVVYRDDKFQTDITFPHSTGKQLNVAIVTDDLLTKIEKGEIDFDVLVANPEYMPKIAKHARVLGPKGLMPNPKNGTVTKDPEAKKKELEGGKITIKTEKKAPLLHIQVGTTGMKPEEILANITQLVKILNPHKIKKLVLSTNMSPGIKLEFDSIIIE